MLRTYSVIDGAKSLRLIKGCEMVFIDKRLQPGYTMVLDCPGKDSIRLWPLPVVDPWVYRWEREEGNEWGKWFGELGSRLKKRELGSWAMKNVGQ